jgi:hypothetical protein
LVPNTRTVNGQALSANVTVTTITGNAGTATKLAAPRNINGVAFDGSADIAINLTGDVTSIGAATTIGAGKVTDAMRVETSAATSATTGTMTVSMTSDLITVTPSGACTFNASGGRLGRFITFVVTTSGTSSFVLTFGTNFKTTATLATGTVSGKTFAITFRCTNGTQWIETSRTAAM